MPRRYIYADDDKDDEQLIWDALGRGSAAGRHLYNLYNGNTDGKRFGNMQSAYNGEVESRKTAEERRLPMEVGDAIKRDAAFLASSAKAAAEREKDAVETEAQQKARLDAEFAARQAGEAATAGPSTCSATSG